MEFVGRMMEVKEKMEWKGQWWHLALGLGLGRLGQSSGAISGVSATQSTGNHPFSGVGSKKNLSPLPPFPYSILARNVKKIYENNGPTLHGSTSNISRFHKQVDTQGGGIGNVSTLTWEQIQDGDHQLVFSYLSAVLYFRTSSSTLTTVSITFVRRGVCILQQSWQGIILNLMVKYHVPAIGWALDILHEHGARNTKHETHTKVVVWLVYVHTEQEEQFCNPMRKIPHQGTKVSAVPATLQQTKETLPLQHRCQLGWARQNFISYLLSFL